MSEQPLIDRLLAAADQIRYVAAYRDGVLNSKVRPGIDNTSAVESDRYEELLVNPTLLTLTRQRGSIDCGGLEYVLVRYGHFFQLVRPVPGGHLSIALEPSADVLKVASRVAALIDEENQWSRQTEA